MYTYMIWIIFQIYLWELFFGTFVCPETTLVPLLKNIHIHYQNYKVDGPVVVFTAGKEYRQIPLFVTREFPTALGVEDTDDDDGDGEEEGGDGDAEDQVQPVPVRVDVSEGQTGVGPAVVAGQAGVVHTEVAEPGRAVHLKAFIVNFLIAICFHSKQKDKCCFSVLITKQTTIYRHENGAQKYSLWKL